MTELEIAMLALIVTALQWLFPYEAVRGVIAYKKKTF
jgi:hypothetical protein